MAKNHLWEHLRDFFPSNTAPIVQEAIYEIGNLEALKTWKPSFLNSLDVRKIPDVWKIVDWGIPLIQIKRMPIEVRPLSINGTKYHAKEFG